MFDRILVANRGEIACRVMETARAMGVETVAVYSDADRGARHVELADLAVHIGGAAPAESYLRGERIIEAAIRTGAKAIHPGYGFLSENPDFVDAVENAGLMFIGPSAKAIRAMGLKDAAKAVMEQARVPVVPGYHGDDQSDAHLQEMAGQIGFPVLIKAVAGGGGKGMRLVEDAGAFGDALASARAEAKTAFGNEDVLVEKYVTRPRHIEVQVFGDGEKAVHLFERDCSLQRRHQKVIEEAPAPGMTDAVRKAMGQAAVRAAEAIGYKGAGTVEFIVDGKDGLKEDGFWFMEMNTRLQVEHPVSEEITGVDLVEWQLRVAAGEPLPLAQEDLSITGHAFEARLYAEDVPKGFLPATGRLEHLAFPKGARADTGVRAGDQISPHYDPMIAKLTVHGPTRAVALRKLAQALEATEVAGTVTNLGFLAALARHEGFSQGDVDTGLIARDLEALTAEPEATDEMLAQAALAGCGLLGDLPKETGFALWGAMGRQVVLRDEEAEVPVRIATLGPDAHDVTLRDTKVEARKVDGSWSFGGAPGRAWAMAENTVTLFGRHGISLDVVDPLDRDAQAAGDGNVIEAPMPGLVREIFAKPGQEVAAGDRLAVLEAMKMEHALLAARDGVVAEVLSVAGSQVEAGAALIRLEEVET